MILRLLPVLLLLAACGFPHVDDPVNPDLAGVAMGAEAEGECWTGADTARIRILCADDLTVDRVTILQRALAARRLYDGPTDGQMGAATKTAIAAYQKLFGREIDDLTLPAAKALGVVPADWPEPTPAPVTAEPAPR